MTKIEMTANALRQCFESNGFKEIVVTMKCNGDQVSIRPCAYTEITDISQVMFYTFNSPTVNLCGSESIDRIADYLLRYEDYIEEDKKSLMDLKKYIRDNGKNTDWSFVSDWHKDLFGHRPHVNNDTLIAWANSDSMESSRLY